MARTVQTPTATTALPYISKSKYLWGLQCPELLWHAHNAKHVIPPPDAQQAIFDQGHEVGALAKRLFPDGIEVGAGATDFGQVIQSFLETAEVGFTDRQAIQRTGAAIGNPHFDRKALYVSAARESESTVTL